MQEVIPYQEALALSSMFAIVSAFIAIIISFNALKRKPEFPYLVGFYIIAASFFGYISFSSAGVSEQSLHIGDILGGLFTLFLTLTVCKKANNQALFNFSVLIYLIHMALSLILNSFVYLPLMLASIYGGIAILAIFKSDNWNRGDLGLVITIGISIIFSLVEALSVDVYISRAEYYQDYFYYPLIIFPAYILAITIFFFSSYLIESIKQYKELATLDPLTGLNNRRSAIELIKIQSALAVRKSVSCAIFMADIDHFKQINDQYGHNRGDDAILLVAKTIKSALRDYDVNCRHGGEEFLVFLFDVSIESATSIANRIRQEVQQKSVAHEYGELTISIGLSLFNHEKTLLENVESADQALYLSKNNGRNRVTVVKDE